MKQDIEITQRKQGFKGFAFTPRMLALLERFKDRGESRPATIEELHAYARIARNELGTLADDDTIFSVYHKNHRAFQVVFSSTSPDKIIGFNAALPLNDKGCQALVEGRLDTLAPDLKYIAGPGESVAAIYVWVTIAPKSFLATAQALEQYVADMAPDGCPMFCRSATEAIRRLHDAIGYEEARLTYPNAPEGLLVVHPIVAFKQPGIDIAVARSFEDMMKIVSVRAATYMSEQECPYTEEFDGNDFCGAHFLGCVDGEPAGCIRVRFFSGFVKFERLAVRREYRRSKLAFRLVREAMRYSARKGYTQVYGHARHDLVRFWQTFGFRKLENGQPLTFSDLDYVEMAGCIPPVNNPLGIGENPYVLIRPEGNWDCAGPLERSADLLRKKRVRESYSKTQRVPSDLK